MTFTTFIFDIRKMLGKFDLPSYSVQTTTNETSLQPLLAFIF